VGKLNNEQKRKSPAAEAKGLDGDLTTHGDSLRESRCVYPIIK